MDSYTFEELLLEFFGVQDVKDAEEKEAKDLSDKLTDEKIDETLSWAEEEEKREQELAEQEMALNELLPVQENQEKADAQDHPLDDQEFPEDINVNFAE